MTLLHPLRLPCRTDYSRTFAAPIYESVSEFNQKVELP